MFPLWCNYSSRPYYKAVWWKCHLRLPQISTIISCVFVYVYVIVCPCLKRKRPIQLSYCHQCNSCNGCLHHHIIWMEHNSLEWRHMSVKVYQFTCSFSCLFRLQRRTYRNSAWLALCEGKPWPLVHFTLKSPIMPQAFQFYDVIMVAETRNQESVQGNFQIAMQQLACNLNAIHEWHWFCIICMNDSVAMGIYHIAVNTHYNAIKYNTAIHTASAMTEVEYIVDIISTRSLWVHGGH